MAQERLINELGCDKTSGTPKNNSQNWLNTKLSVMVYDIRACSSSGRPVRVFEGHLETARWPELRIENLDSSLADFAERS